jgi:hypothetical protein
MKKYSQLILVEFHNSTPAVVNVVSDEPITLTRIIQYYVDNEDFDMDDDGLTFIDAPTELHLN